MLLGAIVLAPNAGHTGPLTVAYGSQSRAQTLDLYRPQAARAPLVTFVHGGGWVRGDKGGGRPFASTLTAMGYAVASVNYRLLDEGTVADAANDVAAATAFLLARADLFGIDRRRFALAGHSSGGHLVALVATDPSYARAAGLDLSQLRAVVALDGVFDIVRVTSPRPVMNPDPAYRREVSPITHTGEITGHRLFCLLHETIVPRFAAQADAFAAALRAHGQHVIESLVPDLNHGALVNRFADPTTPMAAEVGACLQAAFH